MLRLAQRVTGSMANSKDQQIYTKQSWLLYDWSREQSMLFIMLGFALGEKKKINQSRKEMTYSIMTHLLSDNAWWSLQSCCCCWLGVKHQVTYLLLLLSVKKKWAAEPVPFKRNLSSLFPPQSLCYSGLQYLWCCQHMCMTVGGWSPTHFFFLATKRPALSQ